MSQMGRKHILKMLSAQMGPWGPGVYGVEGQSLQCMGVDGKSLGCMDIEE